jgi:hypothetical protein
VATYYLVTDANSAVLDDQVQVFPGFPVLKGEVANEPLFQQYLLELLWPVLFGVATRTAVGTTAELHESPPAVQANRKRRGKRALAPTHRVSPGPALDALRYQGQSGLRGIVAALRTVPAALVPPTTPDMAPILIWVPGKE